MILSWASSPAFGHGSSGFRLGLMLDFLDDGAHHRDLNITRLVAPEIIIADGVPRGVLLAGHLAITHRPGLHDLSLVCDIGYAEVLAQQIVRFLEHLVPRFLRARRQKQG